MKNAEKYNDAIIAQLCKTGDWAMDKSGEIVSCDIDCLNCKFHRCWEIGCAATKVEWLNAEAVEKKVFSEKDKAVIRGLDKINWVAKDEDGEVYGYYDKPYKSGGEWIVKDGVYIKFANYSTTKFADVKWEDDKPTSRTEILGDEQ